MKHTMASHPVWGLPLSKPEILESLAQVALNLFYLAAGSSLCAVALNGILVPNHFTSGGVVGIALILNHFAPSVSLSWAYALLNIPLFILGWRALNLRFLAYSLLGSAFYSFMVELLPVTLPVDDPLAAAVLAGILTGAGGGLILKSQGSAGGGDVLGVILLKKYSIRIGSTVLALNIMVLGASVLLFPLEKLVYTLIFIYVTAKVMDLVMMGLSKRKMVLVVSSQAQKIAERILGDKTAGATLLQTQGAFSGQPGQAVMSAVNYRQLAAFKQSVQEFDPNAFMVVSDTLEVSGQRFRKNTI